MEKEDYSIPIEKALEMLPEGNTVHTFRNPNAGMLIGADWDREEIIESIKKYGAQGSGEQAKAMNHGLVVRDETSYLFIETKKEA